MSEQTFPGTLDSLEPIRDFIAAKATAAGLNRSTVYKLCLAVDEIATNVVMHGYEEAGLSGDLTVWADALEDAFQVDLKDTGRAYDPGGHEQQSGTDLDLPLDQRRIGGLGILLARDSVDDLQYSSGEDGNVHRFIVKFGRNANESCA
jgi:anti-sigma regulatory factor (Ser/Thr protein kinase)